MPVIGVPLGQPLRMPPSQELADWSAHLLWEAVTPYPFGSADSALADLAADRVDGAAVLRPWTRSGPHPGTVRIGT